MVFNAVESEGDSTPYLVTGHKAKQEYFNLFKRFDWEWFATLTFRHNVKHIEAEKSVKEWLRDTGKFLKLQIGAFGVVNRLHHPHVHLLMKGKNSLGTTLLKHIPETTYSLWPYRIDVQAVNNNEAVCKYVAGNFSAYTPDLTEFITYGRWLRQKIRKK